MYPYYRIVRDEWIDLWNSKIDDKQRAEAIARREYAVLLVKRGDVLSAPRGYRSPDLRDIMSVHEKAMGQSLMPLDPAEGGWAKFTRDKIIIPAAEKKRRAMKKPQRTKRTGQGPSKKGGRGWLHF